MKKNGRKKRGKTEKPAAYRVKSGWPPKKVKLTGYTRKARKSRANDRQFQKKRTRGKHQRFV